MEQNCGNCRYFKLDIDQFPCVDCLRASSNGSINYWSVNIKDITDPDEKINAILEGQMNLMFELNRLSAKLDELIKRSK